MSSTGEQGNGTSFEPSISADGRYVAFASAASNLVAGDTNGMYDVFVRDRVARTTVRVSVDSLGRQGNGPSSDLHGQEGIFYDLSGPSISADGRHVAFASHATNLVPGDTNGKLDVFVRDLEEEVTRRVSVSSGGVEGDGNSGNLGLSISGDGRYVAFASEATNLVTNDTNRKLDVFLHDRRDGSTTLVSADAVGEPGSDHSYNPSISADGRFIAFSTSATNIVPTNWPEVVVRDRVAGTIEAVSIDPNGHLWNAYANSPSISADGRYVAFSAFGLNGDDLGVYEIFLRDRETSTTEWISPGVFGPVYRDTDCDLPAISGDGTAVAFVSWSNQLVPEDSGGYRDDFVRERTGGTRFTSVCEPGTTVSWIALARTRRAAAVEDATIRRAREARGSRLRADRSCLATASCSRRAASRRMPRASSSRETRRFRPGASTDRAYAASTARSAGSIRPSPRTAGSGFRCSADRIRRSRSGPRRWAT